MSKEAAAEIGGTMHENGMGPLRPLSVRMSDGTRAQLEILAPLNERSLTEETRLALEHWVEKSKSDPAVLRRAEQVRAEIERDAEARRKRDRGSAGRQDRQADRSCIQAGVIRRLIIPDGGRSRGRVLTRSSGTAAAIHLLLVALLRLARRTNWFAGRMEQGDDDGQRDLPPGR